MTWDSLEHGDCDILNFAFSNLVADAPGLAGGDGHHCNGGKNYNTGECESHPLYGLQCCGISISGIWLLIMNNVITCMVYNTVLELKYDDYDCDTCSLQVSRQQSELS